MNEHIKNNQERFITTWEDFTKAKNMMPDSYFGTVQSFVFSLFTLTDEFIQNNKDRLDWDALCIYYNNITEEFIRKYHKYLVWDRIFRRLNIFIPEDIILKCKDAMIANNIISYQFLSESCMKELTACDINFVSILMVNKHTILNVYNLPRGYNKTWDKLIDICERKVWYKMLSRRDNLLDPQEPDIFKTAFGNKKYTIRELINIKLQDDDIIEWKYIRNFILEYLDDDLQTESDSYFKQFLVKARDAWYSMID